MARATGRPVRLVLTLEETFQAVRRGASEIHVRTGFRRDGTIVFRDIEADYLIGAYADIADRTVAQGQLHRRAARTASRPSGSSPAACSRTPCPRRRSAASATRSRSGRSSRTWTRRRARSASTRSSCGCATSRDRGEAFIPHDTPADGDWAQAVERAAEHDRLGNADAARARPRHRRRAQVRPDDRPLLLDGPAARRRQRRRLRRHVRHGPGRAHDLRPDRRRTSSARRSTG